MFYTMMFTRYLKYPYKVPWPEQINHINMPLGLMLYNMIPLKQKKDRGTGGHQCTLDASIVASHTSQVFYGSSANNVIKSLGMLTVAF